MRSIIVLVFALMATLLITVSPVNVSAAYFVVNTVTDTQDILPGDGNCITAAGKCSLRAAITECNALAGAHIITLPAGTYTQSLIAPNEDANAGGDWDITSNITIYGPSTVTTFIQAKTIPQSAQERVMHCLGGATVLLRDVTIRNGYNRYTPATPGGGGIRIDGATTNVTLDWTIITANGSEGRGAGISVGTSGATLNVQNSGISNNFGGSSVPGSQSAGGGIEVTDANLQFVGPPFSTLTVNNSIIANNTLNSSVISSFGGGIEISAGGATANITNSSIIGNSSNSSSFGGFGGGIYNQHATLNLSNSTVSSNSANKGDAGIRALAQSVGPTTTNITNCTVASNSALSLGGGVGNYSNGIYDATMTITGTTISGNTATSPTGSTAGILNKNTSSGGAYLTMTNSTVSGNISSGNIGGIANLGTVATTALNFCTVTGNRANGSFSIGGGVAQDAATWTGSFSLKNSIVANNVASGAGPDIYGTITSSDYNHVKNVTGGTFVPALHDVMGTNPGLGALANNGGPTLTHRPNSGSPVINTIPNGINGCGTAINLDQTGTTRPLGAGCEKGSVEYKLIISPMSFPSPAGKGGPVFSRPGMDSLIGQILFPGVIEVGPLATLSQ